MKGNKNQFKMNNAGFAKKPLKAAVLVGILVSTLLLTVAATGFATAQTTAPPTEWTQAYGGSRSDQAYDIIQTSDGGYALAGYTGSFGEGYDDYWLVKTNADGIMQWGKTYGGTKMDQAYCVIQTSDGGYAIVGRTASSGAGYYDYWLVKTDADGEMQWNQTYGGLYDDCAFCVVETSDGGYALGGQTKSFGAGSIDYWLVKTDSNGAMQWNQTYGGASADYAFCVVHTNDGGYAIAGYTGSFGAGSTDYWVVKTDANGVMQWNQTYGGTNIEYADSIIQTSDGGYALAGYTASFGAGNYDYWLVKTDANGVMQWNQTYGGSSIEYARCVIQTSDNGYALVGRTFSFGAGNYDYWLVKTDANGVMQWNQTYGGSSIEYARCVIQTSDGGYALAGYTYSFGAGNYDYWAVKIAPESPFVVPEYNLGVVGALVACFAALAVTATVRKQKHTKTTA
ncbi:MAG: hypothetical protein NWF04_03615 [Candidatus Bathyarchaeota archaeon]|nr:hypothetical protein [Candidatus Bathyarchaeota archaeon]